jgi:hypothetical protein
MLVLLDNAVITNVSSDPTIIQLLPYTHKCKGIKNMYIKMYE